jgi:hypothetical protein
MNHYFFVVRRICARATSMLVSIARTQHGHAEHDTFLRSPHLFENTPNKDRHLSAELP